jgi:hypothetical protein
MRFPNAIVAPRLGLLLPLAALSCTTARTQAPGEVVVVVTTDMVTPEDIDTVSWSVTVVGDEAPLKADSIDLHASPLPATIGITGPDTRGPVRIALDGVLAGASRVHREAVLTLPAEGEVRQLDMPLDWLCTHDASPSLACAAGTTCRAGECVSSAFEASDLGTYAAPNAGPCFDVATCLAQPVGGVRPVVEDPITGHCVVADAQRGRAGIPGSAADVNVAMVVNTSQTGNYGACGFAQQCMIPLARDPSEGWEWIAGDGGAVVLGVPEAVCRDMGTTLLGAVVAPASASCPPRPLERPTCAPPDTCITASVCPDWGQDWLGYTCSGDVSPFAVNSMVQACWAPNATPHAGAGASAGTSAGRSCCTTGTGGSPGSLLIDDMSGGPQVKIAPPRGEIAGFWFAGSTDLNAPLVPPPLGLFTYAPVPPAMSPDGGPMNAACLTARAGFSGYAAFEGFNFVVPQGKLSSTGDPFDVSPYTGIRFLAWSRYAGQSIKVSFPDTDTESYDPTSTCNLNHDAGQCDDDWAIQNLTLTDTPVEYAIAWDQLTQAGYGARVAAFDSKHVLGATFIVNGAGPGQLYPPFELCVSQIYFTR